MCHKNSTKSEWDSEKKQSRIAKRVHVGRLNEETGRVSCGKKYLEAHPELVGKELFYEDNKLVERTPEQQEVMATEKQDFSYRCDAISFGWTYACWEIARKHKILSSLDEVFGAKGRDLLRLAIYQLCSNCSLSRRRSEIILILYHEEDPK